MKTATNPSGKTVFFEEAHHKYFVGDVVLTSATTFVGNFFPVFDSENNAKKYAKKHGRTKEDVLSEWEKAREDGEELGHAVHAYAEKYVIDRQAEGPAKYEKYYEGVQNACQKIFPRFEILGVEVIVFSLPLGLSGTIDLLTKDKQTGDIVIFDWKTNKAIHCDNMWRNALPPISHLEDCEINTYGLQLNTYEFILRAENYFPGANYRKGLIHLVEDQPEWYKIGDLQADIKKMIGWI